MPNPFHNEHSHGRQDEDITFQWPYAGANLIWSNQNLS